MKTIKNIATYLMLMLFITACNDGIDPITQVDPGPDAGAPVINIIRPTNGFEIQVPEPITSVNIEFKVEDDIEVDFISVKVDGTEIATYDDFLDYRIVYKELTYDNIATGDHTLSIEATDIAGNVTTSVVNFRKAPPYTPLFNGEMFYMNFDGGFSDLVSNKEATEVGNPSFTEDAYVGSNAYKGATDSYLTFPTEGLLGDVFSASFWYKLNNDPDRAGILVIGPPDEANPDSQNNRNSGFRFFRENRGGNQSFRLNVGNGTGATTAIPDASTDLAGGSDWVHFAFTITQTKAKIYLNGELVADKDIEGLDWTGTDIMSIMSGAPRFTGWSHKSDLSYMDDLRLFNTELTQDDVTELVAESSKVFNMPFNGSFQETISKSNATEVGSPTFTTEAKEGTNAYAGATDSYLTFPTDGLLGSEISAAFWYKLNNDPDRAGILVISPPDEANPDNQNNRNNGFRFFRENRGGNQSFRLSVGNGTGNATAIPDASNDLAGGSDWAHFAFTISQTKAMIYLNGELIAEKDIEGLDWTGCDIMSIMSGAPRFVGWSHKSDLSNMDKLSLYNKVLSKEEIQAIM